MYLELYLSCGATRNETISQCAKLCDKGRQSVRNKVLPIGELQPLIFLNYTAMYSSDFNRGGFYGTK